MKNELEDRVIEKITDIFVAVIGSTEKQEVSPTANLTRGFHMDSDDRSRFAAEVIAHFGIESTQEEWYRIETIEEVADLVLGLLRKQVIETTTDILIDVVDELERDEVSPDKEFVRDMHIGDDDLMVFDMEILKRFRIKWRFDDSRQVGTIEDLADLVIEYLLQSDDPINDPNRSIPTDSGWGKWLSILTLFTAGLGHLLALFASWVAGLGILGVLLAYTDWPFVLIITPVLLWIAVTWWLILRPR